MTPAADAFPNLAPPLSGESDEAWERRRTRLGVVAERIRGNRQLQVGAALLLGFVAVGVYAMLRWGLNDPTVPTNPAWGESLSPPGPSLAHPFGTIGGSNTFGIDLFPAILRAVPVDLVLIGGTIGAALGIGVVLGAWAGFRGGPVDYVVTGAADLVVGVPPFFLVIVLFWGLHTFLTPAYYLLVFAGLFALILWPYYARTVRARAQQVAGEPYVESARAAGATNGHLLWRHLIPNSFFPVLAQIPVDLFNFLFVLTVFPFIACFGSSTGSGFYGLLSPLPEPGGTAVYAELGWLLGEGACHGWSPLASLDFWWMYTFPAAVIIVLGIAVTLTCDGIERYLTGARPAT